MPVRIRTVQFLYDWRVKTGHERGADVPRAKRRKATPARAATGRMLGYIRVSTTQQGLSVERQGGAINAEAIRRRCPACVYTDNGASGTLPPVRRPGLAEALAVLERGDADGL